MILAPAPHTRRCSLLERCGAPPRTPWLAAKALPAAALTALVLAALAFIASSARATSVYTYQKHEFVIVDGGLAPSRAFSIAAHGDGEMGEKHFRLYLMREPAHRKLAPLDTITEKSILDTGPDAFHAKWSSDSGHVAIMWRFDRHYLTMALYEIRNNKPYSMSYPLLLNAVAKDVRESTSDYRQISSVTDLGWLAPRTFTLTERRVFSVSTPDLARVLGAFARTITGDKPSHREHNTATGRPHLLEFCAQAVGELTTRGRLVIKNIKPGPFK